MVESGDNKEDIKVGRKDLLCPCLAWLLSNDSCLTFEHSFD